MNINNFSVQVFREFILLRRLFIIVLAKIRNNIKIVRDITAIIIHPTINVLSVLINSNYEFVPNMAHNIIKSKTL